MGIFVLANLGRALCTCFISKRSIAVRSSISFIMNTAIVLDWLLDIMTNNVNQPKIIFFAGKLPCFINCLRLFGIAGVITFKGEISPKPYDQGTTCMFVSYCQNREGGCCKVYHPVNNIIYLTCNIIWLKRVYFHAYNTKGNNVLDWSNETTNDFVTGRISCQRRKSFQLSKLG